MFCDDGCWRSYGCLQRPRPHAQKSQMMRSVAHLLREARFHQLVGLPAQKIQRSLKTPAERRYESPDRGETLFSKVVRGVHDGPLS